MSWKAAFPLSKRQEAPENEVGVMCNIVTEEAGFTETFRDVVTFLEEHNQTLVTDVTSNIINISTIVSKYFLCFSRASILC